MFDGDYLFSDNVSFASTVWSSCNQVLLLNVNSQIRVSGPSNSTDSNYLYDIGLFSLVLQWQNCTKTAVRRKAWKGI